MAEQRTFEERIRFSIERSLRARIPKLRAEIKHRLATITRDSGVHVPRPSIVCQSASPVVVDLDNGELFDSAQAVPVPLPVESPLANAELSTDELLVLVERRSRELEREIELTLAELERSAGCLNVPDSTISSSVSPFSPRRSLETVGLLPVSENVNTDDSHDDLMLLALEKRVLMLEEQHTFVNSESVDLSDSLTSTGTSGGPTTVDFAAVSSAVVAPISDCIETSSDSEEAIAITEIECHRSVKVNFISETPSNLPPKPAYLQVTLIGEQREKLIDSGSPICVLPSSWVDCDLRSTERTFAAINKSVVSVKGETDVTVNIGQVNFTVCCVVSDDVTDGIFGLAFLKETQAVWDFGRNELKLCGQVFRLYSKSPVGADIDRPKSCPMPNNGLERVTAPWPGSFHCVTPTVRPAPTVDTSIAATLIAATRPAWDDYVTATEITDSEPIQSVITGLNSDDAPTCVVTDELPAVSFDFSAAAQKTRFGLLACIACGRRFNSREQLKVHRLRGLCHRLPSSSSGRSEAPPSTTARSPTEGLPASDRRQLNQSCHRVSARRYCDNSRWPRSRPPDPCCSLSDKAVSASKPT